MVFSGSRAISDTFQTLGQRIGPLLGLWAVFFAFQLVLIFILSMFSGLLGMAGMTGGSGSLSTGALLIAILFYIANFYLAAASMAAMTTTASPISKSMFSEALGIGFRSALPLLGFFILSGIAYFVVAFLFGLVIGLIGAVVGGTVAALVALFVGLPALIFVGTKISMVVPVVAVDGLRNPIAAIATSWSITQGATLKMFLTFLLFAIVALVLLLLVFTPVLGTVMRAVSAGQPPDVVGMIGSFIFVFVGMFVLTMLLQIVMAALVAAMHSQLSGDAGNRFGDTFA